MNGWVAFIILTAAASAANAQSILDTSRSYDMKEVQVRTKIYNYERDSANNRVLFRKAFRVDAHKIKVRFGGGLIFDNLFSNIAYHLTGQKKQARRTVRAVAGVQSQKFIDIRYTQEMVAHVTGLQGDTLALFMNKYPMPFDYARAASELEIKVWVRENYKDWLAKGRPMPVIEERLLLGIKKKWVR